jgi:hypothetical protein
MTHKIKDHVVLRFVIALLLLAACAKTAPAPTRTDSAATKGAVERIQGKTMRTFKGPAEILRDTAKNQRSYLKRKE